MVLGGSQESVSPQSQTRYRLSSLKIFVVQNTSPLLCIYRYPEQNSVNCIKPSLKYFWIMFTQEVSVYISSQVLSLPTCLPADAASLTTNSSFIGKLRSDDIYHSHTWNLSSSFQYDTSFYPSLMKHIFRSMVVNCTFGRNWNSRGNIYFPKYQLLF